MRRGLRLEELRKGRGIDVAVEGGLEADGFSVLRLRYNTGRTVTDNGSDLADLIGHILARYHFRHVLPDQARHQCGGGAHPHPGDRKIADGRHGARPQLQAAFDIRADSTANRGFQLVQHRRTEGKRADRD